VRKDTSERNNQDKLRNRGTDMTIHEFGKKENPVILLLPGTMCHWKGNFDGVIDKLAEDFLVSCVA
jgi:hypothetical protein